MMVSLSSLSTYSTLAATAARQLSTGQEQQVARLQRIDQHVRAHEAAHMAAGGALAGAATYSYVYGPDGKQYAVGGEVGIDTSAERKPADNIAKGEHIVRAAMAPADPSPQDYRVAATGERLAAKGRQDLAAEQRQAFADARSQATSALGRKAAQAYGAGSSGPSSSSGSTVSTYA